MDVKTVFLNRDLEKEIFVRQTEGFTDNNHPNMFCKLQKSFYGLKQSAYCWNKIIDEFPKELGYTENNADPCIYHKRFITENQECILIIAVYVDNLLIASNDTNTLQLEKKRLGERFEMEGEGQVHYILGICVMRNLKERFLTINQLAFLLSVLKRFGMEDCKPEAAPLEPGEKFEKLNDNKVVV